jgi:hypothetical protein
MSINQVLAIAAPRGSTLCTVSADACVSHGIAKWNQSVLGDAVNVFTFTPHSFMIDSLIALSSVYIGEKIPKLYLIVG